MAKRALTPARANTAFRQARALELRIEGYTQDQIAEALGVTQPTVCRMIKRALKERTTMGADELRRLEHERMESLHAEMWRYAKKGDTAAASVVTRLMERRAKLHGLDAPQVSGGAGEDGQVQTLMLYVGLEAGIGPEREQEAIDAAIGTALQTIAPQSTQPRLFVRVYPGVDLAAV